MKKYLKILMLTVALFSITLGALQVFAAAYWFDGDSDLCQDLCDSVGGWDLWKCSINFPDDGDDASGYACLYSDN